MRDIYQSYNLIADEELDSTYIRGSKSINSIVVTKNILDFIEGLKLLKANEIIITNYRALLIDINMEGYFKETLSS